MNEVVSIGFAPIMQEAAPLRRMIAASLRRAIEVGQLKPGDRLVEKELCQQLNVSRTSLREALRELQAEKLVSSVPRGLVVTEITPQDADNIYRVRAALEGLVAEQFAEAATDLDTSKLKDAINELERAYKSGDFDKTLVAKTKFYNVICDGAGNAIVRDILAQLHSRINQLRSTSRTDPNRGWASLAEHKDLASALFARDPRAARAAAIRHIDAAARAVRENRAQLKETSTKTKNSAVRSRRKASI